MSRKPDTPTRAREAEAKRRGPKAPGVDEAPPDWESFIEALEDVPFVADACRTVGVSRASAYEKRKTDPAFRKRWDEALGGAREQLAADYYRLVREGHTPGPCPGCGGTGAVKDVRCRDCKGDGRDRISTRPDFDGMKFFLRALWREQFGKEETITIKDRPVIKLKIVGGSKAQPPQAEAPEPSPATP